MNRNVAIAVLVVLFLAGIGLNIYIAPKQPVISVAAEHLFYLDDVVGVEIMPGGFSITNSLVTSWIVIVLIMMMVLVGRIGMRMVPGSWQNVLEWIVEGLYQLTENVAGSQNAKRFFAIPATIFIYVLMSNWFALFPGLPMLGVGVCTPDHYHGAHGEEDHGEKDDHGDEHAEDDHGDEAVHAATPSLIPGLNECAADEHIVPIIRSPSADLNNTLALALITQFVSWGFGIATLGAAGYFGKFWITDKLLNGNGAGEKAMGGIDFFVGILEAVSEFVKIVAYTFRLFGNIFAGEVTIFIIVFFLPLVMVLPMLGFEIFVGFIQAFVFFILSVAFYTLSVASHDHDHDDHDDHHGSDSAHHTHAVASQDDQGEKVAEAVAASTVTEEVQDDRKEDAEVLADAEQTQVVAASTVTEEVQDDKKADADVEQTQVATASTTEEAQDDKKEDAEQAPAEASTDEKDAEQTQVTTASTTEEAQDDKKEDSEQTPAETSTDEMDAEQTQIATASTTEEAQDDKKEDSEQTPAETSTDDRAKKDAGQ